MMASMSDGLRPGDVHMRDPRLQQRLDRDGFIRVPFLDAAGVELLRSLWDETGPDHVRGIYSNVHGLDPETNRRVDRVITRLFEAPFHRLFAGARLAGASFLVKGAGPDSASTMHQDWNNVEEDRAQSLSIWVPLVDVDERNGALHVIRGSHRLRRSVRSLDAPSVYLDFTDVLEPSLQCVHARAGDAVIYAHNLFHGSKPNASLDVRVCAVSGIVNLDQRLVHHRHAADAGLDTFDVFEVERDFYFSGIPDMKAGRVPDTARWVGRVTVPDHQLHVDEVMAFANRLANGDSTTTWPAKDR